MLLGKSYIFHTCKDDDIDVISDLWPVYCCRVEGFCLDNLWNGISSDLSSGIPETQSGLTLKLVLTFKLA